MTRYFPIPSHCERCGNRPPTTYFGDDSEGRQDFLCDPCFQEIEKEERASQKTDTTLERKRTILERVRAAHALTLPLFHDGESEWRQTTGHCFLTLEEMLAEAQGLTREELRLSSETNS